MSLRKKLILIVSGTAIVVPAIFALSQIAIFYKTDIFVNLNDAPQQQKKWAETESEIREFLASQEVVEVGFRHESKVLKIQFATHLSELRIDFSAVTVTKDTAFLLNEEKLTAEQSYERIRQIVEAVRLVGHEEWHAILWTAPELTQFEIFTTLQKHLPNEPNVIFILPTHLPPNP